MDHKETMRLADIIDSDDFPQELHSGLFFGCGPEVEDLIHHLLFDSKGG